MTVTAPAPPVAEIVRATDVLALQAVRTSVAVSVLLSTTPAAQLAPADRVRLLDLVAEAAERVYGEATPSLGEPLLDRLQDLALDVADGPADRALALYATAGFALAYRLPVPVHDRVVVDPTFATRDLVRAVHRTPRHLVLVLTDARVVLFDGSGESLSPVTGFGFPIEATSFSEAGGRRNALLRAADRRLGAVLARQPAPVFVVGVSRQVAEFRRLTRHLGFLAGSVHGSHGRTPSAALAALVRPVLQEYLLGRRREALHLLQQRAAAGRAVDGIDGAWLAARAETPEMLVVEEGFFYPARVVAGGDLLLAASDVEHPDVIDDVVDEVIELVLARGGWVALVPDGTLAEHDRIALTVRA